MLTPNTSPSCFSTINSDSRFVRQLGGRDQSPGPVAHFLGSLVGAQQTALHQGALRPPVGHTMQGGFSHAHGSLSMFAAHPFTSPGKCVSYSSHLCGFGLLPASEGVLDHDCRIRGQLLHGLQWQRSGECGWEKCPGQRR